MIGKMLCIGNNEENVAYLGGDKIWDFKNPSV